MFVDRIHGGRSLKTSIKRSRTKERNGRFPLRIPFAKLYDEYFMSNVYFASVRCTVCIIDIELFRGNAQLQGNETNVRCAFSRVE